MITFWPFGKTTTATPADPKYLGGKGAGLMEMSAMGLPVPPGFVIPSDVCAELHANHFTPSLLNAYASRAVEGIKGHLTKEMGYLPLVSVRSGSRVSMPGMMDTLLNVGMTESTLPFWSQKLGPKVAFDLYRRLIQMYGITVRGMHPDWFKTVLKTVMAAKYDAQPAKTEADMSVTHLNKLCQKYLVLYEKLSGKPFPQTLEEQMRGALSAVFKSWFSPRAVAYRQIHSIPNDWYTACVIQAMVFGNANEQSCSGVAFSRNPSTGEKDMVGEFLVNAQGEEVVSGTATPLSLEEFEKWNQSLFDELTFRMVDLEHVNKDMVDVEFTVESGKLFILQCRTGKRTAQAAFQIAYDLVAEDKISKLQALARLTAKQYAALATAAVDQSKAQKPIATGLAGSKGVATGRVWFSKEKAMANKGGILVTKETSPDDFQGMVASAGILTQTGGITSHAALVARDQQKACVVGCTAMYLSLLGIHFKSIKEDGVPDVMEGQVITIDGSTGHVYLGEVPMIGGTVPGYVQEMIQWGVTGDEVYQFDATDEFPTEGEISITLGKLKTAKEVAALIHKLNQREFLRGTLSFSGGSGIFDEKPFLSVFGLTDTPPVTVHQVEGLAAFNDPGIVVGKNWTLVGLESFGVPGGKGFHIHRKAQTLKDLLEVENYYEVDDELAKLLVSQGLTVEEFLQKAGRTVKPIIKPITRDQLAYRVLAK